MSAQPTWKLLKNLGDVNPIEYGGFFVFEDTTGVYAPEGEYLVSPEDDEDGTGWIVYRFSLDRLQLITDPKTQTVYLVSDAYRPDWPHALHQYDEWFHKDLAGVARCMDQDLDELRQTFCSADPIDRAFAYRCIGEYHGFENLDSYPLTFTSRQDISARYGEED